MPSGRTYKKKPLIDRFLKKIDKQINGCWLWQATKTKLGYGQLVVDGIPTYAHRIAYELFVGPIPEGMCVLHRCDNPSCVSPTCLWLGTHQDNTRDMWRKNRHYDARGIKHGRAKLTEKEVVAIRGLYKYSPRFTQVKLAALFGVSFSSIHQIIKRKIWKHVA